MKKISKAILISGYMLFSPMVHQLNAEIRWISVVSKDAFYWYETYSSIKEQ